MTCAGVLTGERARMDPFSLPRSAAAIGQRLSNMQPANAARAIKVGHRPRDFSLIPFSGKSVHTG